MTTIDRSGPLLAQIRAHAAAWRRTNAAGGEGAVEERPARAGEAAPDWLAQVAQGVAAIAPADPDRRRKAFRLYLQAALARECGVRAPEDRGFQDLVDRVQETMEADARLRRAIEGAGDVLLRSAGVDGRRP